MFSKFLKKNKNYLDSKSKHDLLHNVYVLYVVFLVAVADIFYILQMKDFYTATVFISVGILTSFFSKNMIVILSISMVSAHIFKYGSQWKEGFETTDVDDAVTYDDYDENDIDTSNEDVDVDVDTGSDSDLLDIHLDKTDIISNPTPEKINQLIKQQNKLLDELDDYKPLLNSIQQISKNLGFIDNNDNDK